MKTNEMCAALGRAHEFFLALKKAGFTDEIISEVIISKNNAMAKKMLAAISAETVKKSGKNIQKNTSVLSDIIPKTVISATTEKFVAKDNFVVNTDKNAKVKISFIESNFEVWFSDKIENPFHGSIIGGIKLVEHSVDGPFISRLGERKKFETTLTELYAMISAQPNGGSGALLNDGFANIFYIRDINNTLRTVVVRWRGSGWDVRAASFSHPYGWDAGSRVFFRNSLES